MATTSGYLRRILLWWRRTGVLSRVGMFVVGSFLLGLLVYTQRPRDEEVYAESNLQVFLLVNFLVAALCILAFLVGRNVIKLVFDRRRKILGSRLRLRLVSAFVGLTLVPTTILFVLASGLVSNALEGWFSTQIESSVDSSLELAKRHYALLEQVARERSDQLATQLESIPTEPKSFHRELERFRSAYELSSIRLLNRVGEDRGSAYSATAQLVEFSEPALDKEMISAAKLDKSETRSEGRDANKFFRIYRGIEIGKDDLVLVVTSRIPPEVSHALSVVTESYREYEQLKLFRSPMRSGNVLTLLLITTFLLFSALWFGFYLAREITVPIQKLAEGTEAVARGNYDVQIRATGDDEIGFLVKSFNKMTADLKSARVESDRRRSYIETILENLAISVIGLDPSGKITSVNASAVELLGLPAPENALGKKLSEVASGEAWNQVHANVIALSEATAVGVDGRTSENRVVEFELSVGVGGRELKLIFTAGRIVDRNGVFVGIVLLFDDITELSKAQHMSAWREVARRIAHEIKNPLTPIQLSAQRLERLMKDPSTAPVVQECVQTIVGNVDSIKRLADEFSRFSRMPTAELRSGDLNAILAETVAPYAEDHSDILFQFIADPTLPVVLFDPEQIRRAVINLLDNAIAALREDHDRSLQSGPQRISIKSSYDNRRRMVAFEIVDNGPGIPPSHKTRIFEPYFSTKKAGTGLGLAVVTSIVSDHQGIIRVFDNQPRGARFLIEFPIAPKVMTQRRFGMGES